MKLTLQTQIKRSLALTVAIGLLAMSSFLLLEPAVSSAQQTDSDTINVNQTVVADITISAAADIELRDLTTQTNTAVGSTTWTVTTNNSAGYTLAVAADSDEALQNGVGDEFTDFNDAGAAPAPWSVTSSYEFGFSAYGNDANTTFTNGSGAGPCAPAQDPENSALNWEGFENTTDIEIASSTTVTTTDGTDTVFCAATEQQGVFAPSGEYQATITATATTN